MSWGSLGNILDRFYIFRSELVSTLREVETLTGTIIEIEQLEGEIDGE